MIDFTKWKPHRLGGFHWRAMCPRCQWTVESNAAFGPPLELSECPHCGTACERIPVWARWRSYPMRRVYFRRLTYRWWKPWTWGTLWRWERYEEGKGCMLMDNDL